MEDYLLSSLIHKSVVTTRRIPVIGGVPEEYIVGKATRIWTSKNRVTDEICWDRVLKKIK